jgi:hypothetical protein
MKKEPQPKASKEVPIKAIKKPKEVIIRDVKAKEVKPKVPRIIKPKVQVEAVLPEILKEIQPSKELTKVTSQDEVPVLGEYRRPTLVEELAAFHMLAWDLNFHRTISMNNTAIINILTRIDSWVGAHGAHNGERSERDIDRQVVTAFWENLAKDANTGKKPRIK